LSSGWHWASYHLVNELIQAVYNISKTGLVEHAFGDAPANSPACTANAVTINRLCNSTKTLSSAPVPPLPSSTPALALSDPVGLCRAGKHAIFACLDDLPLKLGPQLPLQMLQPRLCPYPPFKKQKGNTQHCDKGLVQMTRAFPTASSPAITKAQEVVTGASTLLSKAQSAKEKQRCSATNRPSQKFIIVSFSPPIMWPSTPAMDHANMYLGSHKHSLHFISEEQNHLGGLALFCNDLPSSEDINTIHLFFQTTVDKICKDFEIKSVVCIIVQILLMHHRLPILQS
jgi:hypothetical protein